MAITLDKSHQEDHLGLAMRLEQLEVTTFSKQTEIVSTVAIADANYTVLAASSGKIHIIENVSADRTFTLPAVSAGLHFKFITEIVAADGHDWLFNTGSDTNFYLGGLVWHDTDGNLVATAAGNGTADSIMQITLPDAGTTIEMVCDGLNWVLYGHVNSATAPIWAGQ